MGKFVVFTTLLTTIMLALGVDRESTRIKGSDEPYMVSHTILQGVIEPFESSKKSEIPAWKQMKDAADYKAAKLYLSQALVSYSQLLRHPYMFGDMPIEERYDVFVSMAKILKCMGFQQRAELLLYEAMSYTTNPHEAHYQLSLLALDKEDLQEAKMHMKNCLFHKSDDILILTHLSMVLIAESKLYEAKFYLSQLLSSLEVKTKDWLRASNRNVQDIVDLTARVDTSTLARWLEDMMVRVIHGDLQVTTATSLQLVRMFSNLYTLIGDRELSGRMVFDIGQSLYEGGRPQIGYMMMSHGHSTSNAVVEGDVSFEVVKLRLHIDYPVAPSSTRLLIEHYLNITLFLSGVSPRETPHGSTLDSAQVAPGMDMERKRLDIENVQDVYWPVPLLGWMGLPTVPLIRELLWHFDGVPSRQDSYGRHFLGITNATTAEEEEEEGNEEGDSDSTYPYRHYPLAAAMRKEYFYSREDSLSLKAKYEGGDDEHEEDEEEDGIGEVRGSGSTHAGQSEKEKKRELDTLMRAERAKLGADYSESIRVVRDDGDGDSVSSEVPMPVSGGGGGGAIIRDDDKDENEDLVSTDQQQQQHQKAFQEAPTRTRKEKKWTQKLSETDKLASSFEAVPMEIGILSGHVNSHPVGQTILSRILGVVSGRPTFDTHNFHVTLLALAMNPDHITKKIASNVHAVVNLPLDKTRAWAVVQSLALDVILIPDWAPFPDAQTVLLGSIRMAPVQVCFYVRGGSACPYDAIDYYLLPEEVQDSYLSQVAAAAPTNPMNRPGWLESYSQQVVLVEDWPLLPVSSIKELAGAAAVSGSNNIQNNYTASTNNNNNPTGRSSPGGGNPTATTNLGFVPLEIEGQVFYEDQPVAVMAVHPGQVHPLMDEVIFKIMHSAPNLHLILVLPRVYFAASGAGDTAGDSVGGGSGEDEGKISWARILVRRLWKGGGGLYQRIRLLPTPLNDRRLMQLLRQADLVLDTFPIGNFLNFHALALSVGTPVVTLRPGTKLSTGPIDLGEIRNMLRTMHSRADAAPHAYPGLASALATHPLYQRLLNSSVGRTKSALPWIVASGSAVTGFYKTCSSSIEHVDLESALVAESISEYYSLASKIASDRELAYRLRVGILDAVDKEGREGYRAASHVQGLWNFIRNVGRPWAALRGEYQEHARGAWGSSAGSQHSSSVRRRGRGGGGGDRTQLSSSERSGDSASGASGGRRRRRRRSRGTVATEYDFDDFEEREGSILTE